MVTSENFAQLSLITSKIDQNFQRRPNSVCIPNQNVKIHNYTWTTFIPYVIIGEKLKHKHKVEKHKIYTLHRFTMPYYKH